MSEEEEPARIPRRRLRRFADASASPVQYLPLTFALVGSALVLGFVWLVAVQPSALAAVARELKAL